MAISYNGLWKLLIDKDMKRVTYVKDGAKFQHYGENDKWRGCEFICFGAYM